MRMHLRRQLLLCARLRGEQRIGQLSENVRYVQRTIGAGVFDPGKYVAIVRRTGIWHLDFAIAPDPFPHRRTGFAARKLTAQSRDRNHDAQFAQLTHEGNDMLRVFAGDIQGHIGTFRKQLWCAITELQRLPKKVHLYAAILGVRR